MTPDEIKRQVIEVYGDPYRHSRKGTVAHLEEGLRRASRLVGSVRIQETPLSVTVHVRLRWWSWFLLGWALKIVRPKLLRALEGSMPVGIVWGMRIR